MANGSSVYAQTVPDAYLQRVARVIVPDGGDQLGLIVGATSNRLYVLTVQSDLTSDYPDIQIKLGKDLLVNANWYKDDKVLTGHRLMLISVAKPRNWRLAPVTFFTHSTEGQLTFLLQGTDKQPIPLRIFKTQSNRVALNPSGIYPVENHEMLLGAPLYLPSKGIIGLLTSSTAANLQAIGANIIRDDMHQTDSLLFDLKAYERNDEVIIK